MKKKHFLLLYGIGLVIVVASSSLISVPGYMDAEYYMAGGQQLATGKGFSEPFLWNYLDDPKGLPHPSHSYWMPLTSLIAAGGMLLTGKQDFSSGRLLLLILAALIPPLTSLLSWKIAGDKFQAVFAGILACLPGYYLVYLGTTDSFVLSMLLGSLFFLTINSKLKFRLAGCLVLGCLAGLLHLNRADGILWAVVGAGIIVVDQWRNKLRVGIRVLAVIVFLTGYLIVMGPWFLRNMQLFQALFSPAGSRMLFLPVYDSIFSYPASVLTFENYLRLGAGGLLQMRIESLASNLQSLVAVQGLVFLLPFMLVGFWTLRNSPIVKWALLAWLATGFVMTLVFPQAGQRGGYFHSSAAFQPLFWSAAAAGFTAIIRYLSDKIQHWNFEKARLGFSIVIFLICFLFTSLVFVSLVGGDLNKNTWDYSFVAYRNAGKALDQMGIGSQEIILVNNPPGFFLATGKSSVVIPYPGVDELFAVARRYQAHYLLLEKDTVEGLVGLYQNPEFSPGIRFLRSEGGIHIFELLTGY